MAVNDYTAKGIKTVEGCHACLGFSFFDFV